jgi:hypothetical protein
MTSFGYRARWRGRDYEAFPAPPAEVRLYSDSAADGFSFVRDGRYRLVVPAAEVEQLAYVRLVAEWRGEPFLVRSPDGGWASLEYTGGNAVVAARLGCSCVERGVYRVRVPEDELRDVREETVILEVSDGAPGRSSGARSE